MTKIMEQARRIPLLAETDVLVVGGAAPAGLAAALASAREGVDTLLVDRYGAFGGTIVQAGVETIGWYRHEKTVDAGGIGREYERLAKEMGGTQLESQSTSEALDPEMFKVVADTLVSRAGITPLLHCYGVSAIMEGDGDGGTITGVITESKSGRQAILAKRVIDATGDADIAHIAGAPYRKAPASELMGVSVTFACSNVDTRRFLEFVKENPPNLGQWDGVEETGMKESSLFSPYIEDPFNKAKAAGKIPENVWMKGTWGRVLDSGEVLFMNVNYQCGLDATDVWDLTKGEMNGRRAALMALEALREHTPGFEKATLRNFSSLLGTRETRKIIGAYEINAHDVLNQACFDDSIGIFPEFLDAYGIVRIPTTGRYFQVPYGIILPQKVENLLVAGRSVAGDKVSHAATRQMMCCAVTGQGAGVAAALSIKEKTTCREVPIDKVQASLVRQGVRIA